MPWQDGTSGCGLWLGFGRREDGGAVPRARYLAPDWLQNLFLRGAGAHLADNNRNAPDRSSLASM